MNDKQTMWSALRNQVKRIYWSDGFKQMAGLLCQPAIFARQYRNRPVFSVEIRAATGLFAILQLVLFILTYCREKGLCPDISARAGLYGDADGQVDWFERYFERVTAYAPEIERRIRQKDRIATAIVANVQQLGFRRRYEQSLALAEASELFLQYYRPQAEILFAVNMLVGELSIDAFTLGIHYRGTDKAQEAGRVAWPALVDAVEQTLEREPLITGLLVSSDEPEFLNYIRQHGFACSVRFIPSLHLAVDGKPVHFSGYDGLQIGREALIASLLLSRCGFLIKTASYLSAWSKIFNPDLKVLLISPPGVRPTWFPDSAFWISQRSEPGEIPSIPAFAWYRRDALNQ